MNLENKHKYFTARNGVDTVKVSWTLDLSWDLHALNPWRKLDTFRPRSFGVFRRHFIENIGFEQALRLLRRIRLYAGESDQV